jgi:hypothetical protein
MSHHKRRRHRRGKITDSTPAMPGTEPTADSTVSEASVSESGDGEDHSGKGDG